MNLKRLSLFMTILFMTLLSANALHAELYDCVVAKDGSGNYTTVQDAVLSIRDYKPEGRQRILVKKGVYEEKVVIPTWKTNITLIGEDRDSTIIIWHDHANVVKEGRKIGTFQSFTLKAEGPGFEAENLTIINDAMTYHNPNYKNTRKNDAGVGQAVSIHVESDRAVFRNCRLLGFQDTMFNGNEDSRQLYVDCYIEGTVDFIFGPATCWFENCHLHCIGQGYLTAASTPAHHPYGYVFSHCKVTADSTITREFLGRPWRNWSAVLFKECDFAGCIHPQGWNNWRDPAREKTARYAEYKCTGAGADRSQRVAWSKELTDAEAAQVTLENVFMHRQNIWTPAITVDFRSIAQSLMGAPYKAGTLEEKILDANNHAASADNQTLETTQEPLIINLSGMDCTTFVEYVSAAILSREMPCVTDSVYQRFVQALRYRDSKRGNYASRLHYMTEWIANNEAMGLCEEITATLPGATRAKCSDINFMTHHKNLYAPLMASDSLLRAVALAEKNISTMPVCYVPVNKIEASANVIQEGDIIAFVTNVKGLDVSHVGFAWNENGQLHLLHASSMQQKVCVSDKTLADYAKGLKGCKGIRVVRLK